MPPPSERNEARRKKKNFYAQLKKQEDTKLQELAEKYRDRARERRDGSNQDYQSTDVAGSANNAYRAVAPDVKSCMDAAERRRQLIQESKFLGGDMEHTHLVKGLDYALLQKVRSEIIVKEQEQEIEMEKLAEEAAEEKEKEQQQGDDEQQKPRAEEPEYRTVMGRNIHNTIQFYRSRHIERNELFMPGRMAYVIELDDEIAESDIPTTLIRSKADVPVIEGEIQTLTTNDIVINKLAQILSYLRQGGRGKKNKRRDKDKPLLKDAGADYSGVAGSSNDRERERNRSNRDERDDRRSNKKREDLSIYDDIGDYCPSKRSGNEASSSSTSKSNRRERNYFDKSSEQEERESGGITSKLQAKRHHFDRRFQTIFVCIFSSSSAKTQHKPDFQVDCRTGRLRRMLSGLTRNERCH